MCQSNTTDSITPKILRDNNNNNNKNQRKSGQTKHIVNPVLIQHFGLQNFDLIFCPQGVYLI